jgi:hypothetical protein
MNYSQGVGRSGVGDRGSGVGCLGQEVDRSFRVSMDAKEASRIRIARVTNSTLRAETPKCLVSFDFLLGRILLREKLLYFLFFQTLLCQMHEVHTTINKLIVNNKLKKCVERSVLLQECGFWMSSGKNPTVTLNHNGDNYSGHKAPQ